MLENYFLNTQQYSANTHSQLSDLKEVRCDRTKPLRIKIDPGARFTGLALVSDKNIVWAAELEHRGFAIRDSLTSRRQQRRSRRQRKTRYRKPRFLNRRRQDDWLPPSLMSRVLNIQTWVNRLFDTPPLKRRRILRSPRDLAQTCCQIWVEDLLSGSVNSRVSHGTG
uniref:RRXRR domain-containing protein n=1 Tax=Microseira wollei TaxID=467598 RepID=UPI0021F5BBB4|nr:RRXRR domain-containing protein [Microseira wollei]